MRTNRQSLVFSPTEPWNIGTWVFTHILFDQKFISIFAMMFGAGVVLMTGALLIGYWAGSGVAPIMPLFGDLFHGALALFLLEMGMVAASRLPAIRQVAPFMTAFGVLMPLIGAGLGGLLGLALGFSTGGIALLAALGGSASYIAVPAVMRTALPDANHGLSIAASLGITFPFNVLVGIPLYITGAGWLVAATG